MNHLRQVRLFGMLLAAFVAVGLLAATSSFAAETTMPFTGNTVNGGTVTHEVKGGKHILTLSSDFKAPGSPDPHWMVVDSKGTAYLLDRVKIKGEKEDKVKMSITVPAYVPDIARVQMWCAWAEVVLGDAPFAKPVLAHAMK
ncbi:MAG: hypothetical protein ACM362_10700 [Candidatus Methylomirabilota bacterium]